MVIAGQGWRCRQRIAEEPHRGGEPFLTETQVSHVAPLVVADGTSLSFQQGRQLAFQLRELFEPVGLPGRLAVYRVSRRG